GVLIAVLVICQRRRRGGCARRLSGLRVSFRRTLRASRGLALGDDRAFSALAVQALALLCNCSLHGLSLSIRLRAGCCAGPAFLVARSSGRVCRSVQGAVSLRA